jgi:TrmH family RNA methyltransferase
MASKIDSPQNPLIKRLRALADDPALRRREGLYIIEGPKLALEALKFGAPLRQALLAEGSPLKAAFEGAGVDVVELGERAFASLSDTESPQGVILLAEIPPFVPPDLSKLSLAVAVERLQDPGNLGTLLRSALAAGVDWVMLSEGCADFYAPKVLRASGGAQWQLAIEAQAPLEKRLKAMAAAGIGVYALDPHAKQGLWDTDLSKPACLLLGSEGQGLSPMLQKASRLSLRLDYPGQLESMNAAVSASIALFELLRQRRN